MTTTTTSDTLNTLFPYLDPSGWNLQIDDLIFNSTNDDDTKVKVDIDGFEGEIKLDEKEADGQNGASLTGQGYRLARGTITVSCWNDLGWQFLQTAIALLRPKKGAKDPVAHEIYHPSLLALDITKIFVQKVSAPKFAGGMITCTFSCIEFAPPAKAAKKSATKPLAIGDVPDALSSSTKKDGAPPAVIPPSTVTPTPT